LRTLSYTTDEMARECLNRGQRKLRHAARDLPYEYKGDVTVIPKVSGWHCPQCHDAKFDSGEGVRFAEVIERIAAKIDAGEAAELARTREKLKLTPREAAKITGGGPNAFSRYEQAKAKPLPAVINRFRLLDRHPELLGELRHRLRAANSSARRAVRAAGFFRSVSSAGRHGTPRGAAPCSR